MRITLRNPDKNPNRRRIDPTSSPGVRHVSTPELPMKLIPVHPPSRIPPIQTNATETPNPIRLKKNTFISASLVCWRTAPRQVPYYFVRPALFFTRNADIRPGLVLRAGRQMERQRSRSPGVPNKCLRLHRSPASVVSVSQGPRPGINCLSRNHPAGRFALPRPQAPAWSRSPACSGFRRLRCVQSTACCP